MTATLLDTNVIVRFLVRDDPVQSPAAAKLFAAAAVDSNPLAMTPEVIAETVWVLTRVYRTPRPQISRMLTGLLRLPGVTSHDKPFLIEALRRYGETTLDIVDCLLAANAGSNGARLATFDRGIGKAFSDVEIWNPESDVG